MEPVPLCIRTSCTQFTQKQRQFFFDCFDTISARKIGHQNRNESRLAAGIAASSRARANWLFPRSKLPEKAAKSVTFVAGLVHYAFHASKNRFGADETILCVERGGWILETAGTTRRLSLGRFAAVDCELTS
jgi:hypothetical protein